MSIFIFILFLIVKILYFKYETTTFLNIINQLFVLSNLFSYKFKLLGNGLFIWWMRCDVLPNNLNL